MSARTLLVVDSNPATHRKVDDAVRVWGCQALHALDASGAEELLVSNDVDVVLSAITLPHGNGYDFARRLRERHPAAMVFLFAGGFEVFDAARAQACGVDGRIPLPFTPGGLRARLEGHLGGPLCSDPVPADPPPRAAPAAAPPPVSEERLAHFLPRGWHDGEPVQVDPEVVWPALERSVLEVLPEVVETVLRTALLGSEEFRGIVAAAVDDALQARLPELTERALARQLQSLRGGRER